MVRNFVSRNSSSYLKSGWNISACLPIFTSSSLAFSDQMTLIQKPPFLKAVMVPWTDRANVNFDKSIFLKFRSMVWFDRRNKSRQGVHFMAEGKFEEIRVPDWPFQKRKHGIILCEAIGVVTQMFQDFAQSFPTHSAR